MRPRHAIATVVVALLGASGGWLLAAGPGERVWLANSPVGRWLHLPAPGAAPAGMKTANGVPVTGVGQAIGPLTLTDLDGQSQTLPRGRRVLVNLWASWCAPCRQEMPLLDAYARTQGGKGVVVVGIAEDAADPIREFLRKSPISYPVLLDDAQGRAGTRLGNPLGILPFSALLDADGKLLRTRLGAFPDPAALQRWVTDGN